ncbi:hypothetical protein ABEB36_005687 [Hypothenemus hampei]|uniref:Uncharacterized protein n=1 Tax=Hypothenemus hampei TaxID=57062 RepID=A0ABD1EZQ7_HYPHA
MCLQEISCSKQLNLNVESSITKAHLKQQCFFPVYNTIRNLIEPIFLIILENPTYIFNISIVINRVESDLDGKRPCPQFKKNPDAWTTLGLATGRSTLEALNFVGDTTQTLPIERLEYEFDPVWIQM